MLEELERNPPKPIKVAGKIATPLIKGSMFYKKIYNRIYKISLHAVNLCIGQPGSGKSSAALTLASDLDPNFTMDRVIYSENQFFNLLVHGDRFGRLKKGSCIIFDEAVGSEGGMDSRQALTKTNKRLSFLATTFRKRGLIVFYISPLLDQLDKRIRTVGVFSILDCNYVNFAERHVVTKLHFIAVSSKKGKLYWPRPLKGRYIVDPFNIKFCSKQVWSDYDKIKDKFNDEAEAKWLAQTEQDKQKSQNKKLKFNDYFEHAKKMLPELLDVDGKVSSPLVHAKVVINGEGLGERIAENLKKALQDDLNLRVTKDE